MRIGIVYLGRHGPGGPIALELASHLAKKADVFAVVSRDADHIAAWRECGIPVIETPTFTTRLQALASLVNLSRHRELAERIAARGPDVLIYPMVHPWTPLLQRRLRSVPQVVTVHDPIPHPGLFHQMSGIWA